MHSSESHHLTHSFPSAPELKQGSHVNRTRSEAAYETGSAPCVSLSLHAVQTRGFPNGARTTMHSHSRGAPTVSLRHAPAVLCRSFPHASLSNYAFPIAPRANHHATRPPVRWQLRESPFVIPVCQLKCW